MDQSFKFPVPSFKFQVSRSRFQLAFTFVAWNWNMDLKLETWNLKLLASDPWRLLILRAHGDRFAAAIERRL
jgi:hypothetical protein